MNLVFVVLDGTNSFLVLVLEEIDLLALRRDLLGDLFRGLLEFGVLRSEFGTLQLGKRIGEIRASLWASAKRWRTF